MENNFKNQLILFGSVFVVLLIVYSQAIFGSYGIYDANKHLLEYGWTGHSVFTEVMLSGGRWLYAGISSVAFGQLAYHSDLWILRAFAFISLLAFSWVWIRMTRTAEWPLWLSLASLALLAINPATGTYIFWSACFPFPLAMIFGLFGGYLWLKKSRMSCLVAMLSMQMALAIYQPAAVAFLLPCLLHLKQNKRSETVKNLYWTAGGCSVAYFFHYLIFLAINYFIPSRHSAEGRIWHGGSSIGELLQQTRNLIEKGLLGWGELLNGNLGIITAVFLGLGILIRFAEAFLGKGWRANLLEACGLIALLGLAFLPGIISANGYLPYRLMFPIYAVFSILALLGYYRVTTLFSLRIKKNAVAAICFFPVGIVVAGHYIIVEGVVKPRTREVTVLNQFLSQYQRIPQGLVLRRPNGAYPVTEHVKRLGEYGAYEVTFDGFTEAYIALVMLEHYKIPKSKFDGTHPLNHLDILPYPYQVVSVPPLYPIFDSDKQLLGANNLPITKSSLQPVIHPILGNVQYYAPDYYRSDWFGDFRDTGNGWARNNLYGWFVWESKPGETPIRIKLLDGQEVELTADNPLQGAP